MTKAVLKGVLAIFLIVSCSKNNKSEQINSQKIAKINKIKIAEKTIFPDFIHLSETDFEKFANGENSKWFRFKNQKLFFIPYTDYSITTLILTDEPLKNKKLIELMKADKIMVEDSLNSIETTEIQTDKKIKLGMSKIFVEKIYGKPDSTKINNGNETLYWTFTMNENRNNYEFGNLKPFVHDGLEFSAELIFKNSKLKTLIYNYQIP